jgi:hypothetical protein
MADAKIGSPIYDAYGIIQREFAVELQPQRRSGRIYRLAHGGVRAAAPAAVMPQRA